MTAIKKRDSVPCPSCGRLLALPEENWQGLAQCPACRDVFTPAALSVGQAPSPAEADPDTTYREKNARDDTRVQVPRRRKRRRQQVAEEQFVLVPRSAKILFLLTTALYVALKWADAPRDPDAGGNLLMAPIAGVCVAMAVLVLQGLFWKREAMPGSGKLLTLFAVVGFILGAGVVLTFVFAALWFAQEPVRWGEVAEVLFVAPFVGLLGGVLAWLVAAFVLGVRQIPSILALAAESEELERSRDRADPVADREASEHIRLPDSSRPPS